MLSKKAVQDKPHCGCSERLMGNEGYVFVGIFQPSPSVAMSTFIRKDG